MTHILGSLTLAASNDRDFNLRGIVARRALAAPSLCVCVCVWWPNGQPASTALELTLHRNDSAFFFLRSSVGSAVVFVVDIVVLIFPARFSVSEAPTIFEK